MIISWNTTNQCNQHCSHCYRDSGTASGEELTLEEGKALLNEIAQAGFKIMIFSGGEPLMVPWITDLVDYASAIGLKPVIGTNGTLITPEKVQELKNAGAMGMGISLDSLDPDEHDTFRSTPGAWKSAIDGMNHCREAGLPFQIHTTVTRWNHDQLGTLSDFAVDIGAVAHHMFFLIPAGRGVDIEDQSLDSETYEATLRNILQKQQDVPIELKPTCAPQFMTIAKEMGMEMRFNRGCLAGTHYCIIDPKGNVQPCPYMNVKVGNVRQTSFRFLWKNSPIFQDLRTMAYSGACGDCPNATSCGGCRARAAFYNHGDYMAPDPICTLKRF